MRARRARYRCGHTVIKFIIYVITYLFGFLLELLDGTLVDTTALVDQVTSCRTLARVDVTDDDGVDV